MIPGLRCKAKFKACGYEGEARCQAGAFLKKDVQQLPMPSTPPVVDSFKIWQWAPWPPGARAAPRRWHGQGVPDLSEFERFEFEGALRVFV